MIVTIQQHRDDDDDDKSTDFTNVSTKAMGGDVN